MLVLARKVNQSIEFGDGIKVTILGVEGDRVSVGIDAPKSVRIFRSELLDETRSLNRQSISSAVTSLKSLKSGGEEGK